MLVLTRNVGEKIVIPTSLGTIEVTLVEIRGAKARIGIAAPEDIPVHREEVWARILNPRIADPLSSPLACATTEPMASSVN